MPLSKSQLETLVVAEPDGRELLLYGRDPITVTGATRGPSTHPYAPNAHLRWHPLRGEWVVYTTNGHRRPVPEVRKRNGSETPAAQLVQLPDGTYDVAVFENLFPPFTRLAHDPPHSIVSTREALGACEVVVFSRDPEAALGSLPLWHLELILEVWADRYRELGARPDVEYVYPFENRGSEAGQTWSHPHGQIFAYPFVPPVAALELANQLTYFALHGQGLVESIAGAEVSLGRRLIYDGPHAVAFVPAFARYAYEVWVTTRQPVPSVAALDAPMRADFARALKTVLLKYDGLWHRPFPYVMAFHQAPTDGRAHPEAHLHVEFCPAYRTKDRLNYFVGNELGAGVFIARTDPSDMAAELRAVPVAIE